MTINIEPGDSYHLNSDEFDGSLWDQVNVTPDGEGGYFIEGTMPLQVFEWLPQYTDLDIDKYFCDVVNWLETEYGALIDRDDLEGITFTAHTGPGLTTDTAASILEDNTEAIRFYNESDPGTYGCRNLWRVLAEHLERLP